MAMEDAIRSTVAEAVETFAAYVGALPHAAPWTPSSPSCFSAPTSCDMISRIHVKARWLIRMLSWVRATLDDAEDMDITEEPVRHWLRQLQDAADAAEDVLDEFSHEALRLGFVGDEADAPSASPPKASSPTRGIETPEHDFWRSPRPSPSRSPSPSQSEMHLPEESVRHLLRQLQDATDAAEDVLDEFPHEADAPTRGIEKPEHDLWRNPSPSQRERYLPEEFVCHWLRQLQDAAEDVLDDFPHEALRLGFVVGGVTATDEADAPSASPPEASPPTLEMMAVRGQVRCSSSPTSPLEEVSAFLRDVEKRIEEIASRFVEIEKPEQALKHEHIKEQMDAESTSAGRATCSVMEELHIVGRHEELAKIKQFLLSSGAEEEESRGSGGDMDDVHVSVTAIVGMGGLGKTTLAQLAYNDAQVNQHFQLKAWVCVSEEFDVIRLTKAMLQCLEKKASGLSELDPLQQKLMQKLEGKQRFLLVLDDVWEAENLNIHNWNLLTAPLCNISADTKIIMTTRSKKVSEMVATNSTCQLGFLSDEDTLELFMLHAFEGRDPSLYQNLVAIGVNITRKCGGVPLVAKTLGGLLLSKDDEEWNKILESEAWNATINREDSIIPLLRLSYQHLPAPLKRCFRYCSLFPKDYKFFRYQIIQWWMAQGYIKTNRRELMEDTGQRYIDDLLSRSFFQHSSDYGDFQMHDLMHDLARCVSKDECYTVEDGDKPCPIPVHVRHLSVFPTGHHCRPLLSSMKDISEPKSFRSFLLPDEKNYLSISQRELLSVPCTRMEHLRVLHMGYFIFYDFPKSIACLKHLRYLHLHIYVRWFPEFLGSLYHLQTLYLKTDCKQLAVPGCISNLHKLRHLIFCTPNCVRYPVGIGKLTDLQTMPSFYVSPEHSSAKLGELKDINSIRGKFAIKGLGNLTDVNEAKKACLNKKRDIRSLYLGWCRSADSSHIDDEVLESLKPSVKLGGLEISGFKGPSYPSWLGDQSFSRLGIMKLEHCEKWISLPPLGWLPSLKSLCISEARAVEYIGSEFFSGGFTQLEELTLREMYNWKSWCGAQKGECAKLKKLSIKGCKNLKSLLLINLGTVEYISISGCPKLQFMSGDSLQLSHLPRAQTIKIRDICEVGHISAHFFLSPLHLYLDDVGQAEAEYMLGMCSHICRLTVRKCSNLTSLPLGNQSALEYVEIRECLRLQITSVSPQLWQLPSLQKIYVRRIHGAECIDLLKRSCLRLTNVDQSDASFLLNEFSHMIPRLTITRCANLMSLPLAKLTTLEYLEISECNPGLIIFSSATTTINYAANGGPMYTFSRIHTWLILSWGHRGTFELMFRIDKC